jgi:transcriptional regulator with XRE-family HTH domain
VAAPKGPFYEQLGKNLATARRRIRLTQDRLAAAVEMSRTSITNIEKGRQIVPVHLLARLAQTLNVTVTDLLEGADFAPAVDNGVQQQLSSLGPEQRAWAERVLSIPHSVAENHPDATSIQPRSSKGGRTAPRRGSQSSSSPRRSTR